MNITTGKELKTLKQKRISNGTLTHEDSTEMDQYRPVSNTNVFGYGEDLELNE